MSSSKLNRSIEPSTKKPSTAHASSIEALVDAAIANLDSLESKLDLDITIHPKERAQMRTLNRVSAEAVDLAQSIVAADPVRFRDFDAKALGHAAVYVEAMNRLLARVTDLAQHVQKSVLNARFRASQQTLALYATLKGLGRILGNEALREKSDALAKELATKRKPKLTEEQKAERRIAKAKAKRVERAQAILAANQPSSPTPAQPVVNTKPSPFVN